MILPIFITLLTLIAVAALPFCRVFQPNDHASSALKFNPVRKIRAFASFSRPEIDENLSFFSSNATLSARFTRAPAVRMRERAFRLDSAARLALD
jgi:hypothetical protein